MGAQIGNNPIAERSFPPEADSAPAARRFVLGVGWSNESDINSRLATLVSEIVTNAILHARTPFRVAVFAADATIRVTVRDESIAVPVKKAFGATQPTGRGLHIVEATADRWGVAPSDDGKEIWFELDKVASA